MRIFQMFKAVQNVTQSGNEAAACAAASSVSNIAKSEAPEPLMAL